MELVANLNLNIRLRRPEYCGLEYKSWMEGKYSNQVHDYVSLYEIHNATCLCGGSGRIEANVWKEMIEGIKRNATTYVGHSIVRKTDAILNKGGEDVVVCLPGARIMHVTERVEKIVGRGKGGTILVHVGTNNADKEETTAIVDKYRTLLKKKKEARVGQIILSGILPVFGNRIDGYRNSKRMAINGMMKRLCKEEDVGYVDLWESFVGIE